MARAILWAVRRKRENGGEFLAVNAGRDESNYQVLDLAEAVARQAPGTKVSINTNAPPDKRSYRVHVALFRSLAPDFIPQVSLDQSIIRLRDGLVGMGFADKNFRASPFMRLGDSRTPHGGRSSWRRSSLALPLAGFRHGYPGDSKRRRLRAPISLNSRKRRRARLLRSRLSTKSPITVETGNTTESPGSPERIELRRKCIRRSGPVRKIFLATVFALMLAVVAKAATSRQGQANPSGGGGYAPTLQAIDGEEMTSPTTMSKNFFSRNGYSNAASKLLFTGRAALRGMTV